MNKKDYSPVDKIRWIYVDWKHVLLLLLVLLLNSCLNPGRLSTSGNLLLVLEDSLSTVGFARDVSVVGEQVYVAASLAGVEIWSRNGGSYQETYQDPLTGDVAQYILTVPSQRLLMVADRKTVHYRFLNNSLTTIDSTYYSDPWVYSLDPLQFSDANCKDLAVISGDTLGSLTVFVADGDWGDGLKKIQLDLKYEPVFQVNYWQPQGVKLVQGHIVGLALKDSLLAVTMGELGIALYRVHTDSLELLAQADTPGEALEAEFAGEFLLVADNWAGVEVYSVSGDQLTWLSNIALRGWAKHIAVWQQFALVACGENSLYIVDISDPAQPRLDGYLETGYIYRGVVSGDRYFAATRRGVKIYQLLER